MKYRVFAQAIWKQDCWYEVEADNLEAAVAKIEQDDAILVSYEPRSFNDLEVRPEVEPKVWNPKTEKWEAAK